MQINRLFETLHLLINRGHITARELAERFEVSVRTVYRDIDVLSAAGVPVYATQGAGGGIHIAEKYVLNKSALTDEEQAQILFALESLAATEHPSAGALLSKLGSLFDKRGDWIEVDFSRWGGESRDTPTLSALQSAILGQRALTFTYFSSQGKRTARTVCPVKLLYKSRAWYLQAFDPQRQGYRTFKLYRMTDVALTDETFDRAALPMPRPMEVAAPMPPLLEAVLTFDPKVAWRVFEQFDPRTVSWDADGLLTLRATLFEDDWLIEYLISFGENLRIVSPDALRLRVAETLRKILARHEQT